MPAPLVLPAPSPPAPTSTQGSTFTRTAAVGAEGLQRPLQRTPTRAPMGDPGGETDATSVRSADLTNDTAHGGDEALADGQPDAEREGPAPDIGCADGPHRPSTADHAGAAPRAHLAARAHTGTPGEALPRDPEETSAGSEARKNHTRRVHPEPQRDQADDRPLTVPRQAHLMRDYTTLGQIAATGEGQTTASGAADRTTDERNARAEGTRVEAATNTASEPVAPPPGAAPPWGRGHLDYARLEGDAGHPSEQAEQEATQHLSFWTPGLSQGSSSNRRSAYDGYFLRGPATSRREHAPWQTSRLVIGQGIRLPPP